MPSISLTPRNPTPVDDEIRKYNVFVKEFTSCDGYKTRISLVKTFLKLDHLKIPDCDFNIRNADGWTPLMVVSRYNKNHFSKNDVKRLLDVGADVNLQEKNGWTALMMTSRYNRICSTEGTVKMLLDAGADVNLRTNTGYTALMLAARCSGSESTEGTVKMLLNAGADVNLHNQYGMTALMMAARNSRTGSTEGTVNMLIDAGADVNLQDTEVGNGGWTALMLSVRYLKTSTEGTVRMLLDAGADVNIANDTGSTALMYAARFSGSDSSEHTVDMLLDAGADVNRQHNEGWSALMWASHYYDTSSKETIVRLLKAGADASLKNNEGKTAYDLAEKNILREILRDAMKPKTNVLSTISLGDWTKGTTFRVVLERLSPDGDENKPSRDKLATIEVEEGDSGDVTLTMSE